MIPRVAKIPIANRFLLRYLKDPGFENMICDCSNYNGPWVPLVNMACAAPASATLPVTTTMSLGEAARFP